MFHALKGTSIEIGVTIRTGAVVVDVTLRDGVTVPNGAVITTQAQADALN